MNQLTKGAKLMNASIIFVELLVDLISLRTKLVKQW